MSETSSALLERAELDRLEEIERRAKQKPSSEPVSEQESRQMVERQGGYLRELADREGLGGDLPAWKFIRGFLGCSTAGGVLTFGEDTTEEQLIRGLKRLMRKRS